MVDLAVFSSPNLEAADDEVVAVAVAVAVATAAVALKHF